MAQTFIFMKIGKDAIVTVPVIEWKPEKNAFLLWIKGGNSEMPGPFLLDTDFIKIL